MCNKRHCIEKLNGMGKTWRHINIVRQCIAAKCTNQVHWKITFGIVNRPQKIAMTSLADLLYMAHSLSRTFSIALSSQQLVTIGRWIVRLLPANTAYAFGHTMFMVIKTSAILIKWHIRCEYITFEHISRLGCS